MSVKISDISIRPNHQVLTSVICSRLIWLKAREDFRNFSHESFRSYFCNHSSTRFIHAVDFSVQDFAFHILLCSVLLFMVSRVSRSYLRRRKLLPPRCLVSALLGAGAQGWKDGVC
jgi:hypothetical protein